MPTRKFQCPFCGYRFLADPEQISTTGRVTVVRGKQTRPEVTAERSIDLKCPSCEKEFEVKLEV